MKSFILAAIFVACVASADNTQFGQLNTQIRCYLKKLKSTLPADAVAQDEALIKDTESIEANNNLLSEKGIGHDLRDAHNQFVTVLPKLKDQKFRTLAMEMTTKLKAAAAEFESGNGNFKDLLALDTHIRDMLKKNFGGGCGTSTQSEGVNSSDGAAAKIKKDLTKLKASAAANARPIYDRLAENTDDVLEASQEFDRKKLANVLEKDVDDVKKLIATMKSTKSRKHQMEILKELEALAAKFKSGEGTYPDIYNDFYLYILKRLDMDV